MKALRVAGQAEWYEFYGRDCDVRVEAGLARAEPRFHEGCRRWHAACTPAALRVYSYVGRRRVWGMVAEAGIEWCWYNVATGTALSGAALKRFSNNGIKRGG